MKSAGTAAVVIKPEKTQYRPGEIAYIDINIEDQNGIVECNDDRCLSVSVVGGELLGFGSANPCTEENFLSGSYKTYYGRALAVIRVGNSEKLTITATDGSDTINKEIPVEVTS